MGYHLFCECSFVGLVLIFKWIEKGVILLKNVISLLEILRI